MISIAPDSQPLRYFIHDDFDALRMEISGSLVGAAARGAYDVWRTALHLARRTRLVVDISYVTHADEYGEAVLQTWQEQEVQFVASSPVSLAIANSIPRAPAHLRPERRTLANRLDSLFCRPTVENRARAESAAAPSAESRQKNAENNRFPFLSDAEQRVR